MTEQMLYLKYFCSWFSQEILLVFSSNFASWRAENHKEERIMCSHGQRNSWNKRRHSQKRAERRSCTCTGLALHLSWAQAWPLLVGTALTCPLSWFFVLFLSKCQARHRETRGVWRGEVGSMEDSSVGEALASGCKLTYLVSWMLTDACSGYPKGHSTSCAWDLEKFLGSWDHGCCSIQLLHPMWSKGILTVLKCRLCRKGSHALHSSDNVRNSLVWGHGVDHIYRLKKD